MLSIEYDRVYDGLWVGSYPQQPEDVLHLKSLGIDGVLNVQSNEDFGERGINWTLFWNFYVSQGVQVVRVPIIDFNNDDLLRNLPTAVTALEKLRSQTQGVYLHCTAGINRSPTVAIAWLVQHQSMSVEDALAHVKEQRRCLPCTEMLEVWGRRVDRAF